MDRLSINEPNRTFSPRSTGPSNDETIQWQVGDQCLAPWEDGMVSIHYDILNYLYQFDFDDMC